MLVTAISQWLKMIEKGYFRTSQTNPDRPGIQENRDGKKLKLSCLGLGLNLDSHLIFQAQDKGGGRIAVVLGNEIPDGGDIRLGRGGDINPVSFWHV
jgi:hypothetical protein